jgi:hypothetical protein
MAKKDKTISCLETVYAALKPLKDDERKRVLASVNALLEMVPNVGAPNGKNHGTSMDEVSGSSSVERAPVARETETRPVAIRELIQDKGARSHPQLITLFAYYREKYQNKTKFSRDDLKQYYEISRENPPKNFIRDFVEVVRRGWIQEEGDNSYITTKGIEAVESGFAGSRKKRVKPKKHLGKGGRKKRSR